MKNLVNVKVSEKFQMDGFKMNEPKIYNNVSKITTDHVKTYIYVNDKCVAAVDNFYHSIQVAR